MCIVANGTTEQGEDSKLPEGETAEVISSPKEDARKKSVSEVLYKVSLILFVLFFVCLFLFLCFFLCLLILFLFFCLFVCLFVCFLFCFVLPEVVVKWQG